MEHLLHIMLLYVEVGAQETDGGKVAVGECCRGDLVGKETVQLLCQ